MLDFMQCRGSLATFYETGLESRQPFLAAFTVSRSSVFSLGEYLDYERTRKRMTQLHCLLSCMELYGRCISTEREIPRHVDFSLLRYIQRRLDPTHWLIKPICKYLRCNLK